MTIHEYVLRHSDILAAITLKVDYVMSPASLDEHGRNLIYVNHYELCAIDSLDQAEWWPFVHCMYELQDCLNYNTTAQSAEVGQTCAGADAGVDDDLEIAGTESGSALDSCDCTLTGVVDYCATAHTTTTLSALTECAYSSKGHELAVKSKTVADAINSGDPLWLKIDNITLSDSINEKGEIDTWAATVKSAICNKIELGSGQGSMPASC